MAENSDTFSIRLADDVRHQVDELARLTKRSRAFIVKEAVEAYVRGRADFLRELDSAIASARSGTGHSSKQVFTWMEQRSGGGRKPLPRPDIAPEKRR